MLLKIKPQPGPQTAFLASTASLVFTGGAAGGGKSYGLLLNPLRYLTKVPGFSGVIFRRTFPEIIEPGALWDTSVEVYGRISGVVPRVGYLDWTFPPYGNRVSFHHLQHPTDVFRWQGSQVTYFGWDEITHFTQRMFEYITFSRGRSQCEIESYTRCTCNPDPGWVKTTFLAPWVDKTFKGVKAESGEHRYFIRDPDTDKLKWVPRGTEYAQSITFIPSRVTDNPIMLKRNPGYIAKLKALPRVERERLLDANWDVAAEGLVYPEAFDPEFQVIVEHEGPRGGIPDEGGIDYGLTAPFVALWGYVDYDDVLWVVGERYVRGVTIPEHSKAIPKGIQWHSDPAGAQETLQLKQGGHHVRSCVHVPTRGASGEVKSAKRSGIDMVRHRMKTGRLKIVRGSAPNLVRELGLYINDPEKPDSEEPLKENDHACFPAGTIVRTSLGDIPIQQVRTGDQVLTRNGFYPVKVAGLSGLDRQLWHLLLSDGLGLYATADHPIWTENRGWVRLDALRYGDIMDTVEYSIDSIRSKAWEYQRDQLRRLSSAVSSSDGIPNLLDEPIGFTLGQLVEIDSIGQSGGQRTDQSQMGGMSITSTKTRSITIPATLNACQDLSIFQCTAIASRKNNGSTVGQTWIVPENLLRGGTALMRGVLGIANTVNKPGWAERLSRKLVSIVVNLIRLRIARKQAVFVRPIAGLMLERSEASTTRLEPAPFARKPSRSTNTIEDKPAPVFVVNVSDSGRSADVYNLTVDGPHEYYANGVLVKNCDALRYWTVGRDRGRYVPDLTEYPTEAQEQAQEQADRKTDLERRRKLEEEAQADPLLDRWFDV